MKQLLQHARTGEIGIVDVPAPRLLPGCVLVRIAASLVSAGTERASSEFARKNLLQKARARPDLVREVLTKARRDGILSAISATRSRLDQPTAPGYSSAGTVVGVGEGVNDISVGDHVASSGAGYAVHGEFACVPRLLLAKIPVESNVTPEDACFSALGAVAMHGLRTAGASLGDVIAVIGLGLVGQLTVQLLKAAGCCVIGMDILSDRAGLASSLGADAAAVSSDELIDLCSHYSYGRGADAAIVTAETASSAPVNLAGVVCRDRGRVVAVGTVGMEIDRKVYYEKEIDFRVSRSYGPGRYDAAYEQKGRDYPIGYVRWTENRNMEAFIRLLSEGKVDVRSLITHRFPLDRAEDAYDLISGNRAEPSLGIVLTYLPEPEPTRALQLIKKESNAPLGTPAAVSIGVLGAGAFATNTLLPAIRRFKGLQMIGACAANSAHALDVARRFGFQYATTDEDRILCDDQINAVIIATRNNLHASQVIKALAAGKHVFCEKPLCLTQVELDEIVEFYCGLPAQTRPLLSVGFNRRFSPMALKLKTFLDESKEPMAAHYRVNAGALAQDHWVNDPAEGGGRLVGEACHFIDLLCHFAGASPVEVHTREVSSSRSHADNLVISLKFGNGSHGTVSYLSNGDRAYSKERIEILTGGSVAVLDDFRRLELHRHGRTQVFRSRFRQNKGHKAELDAFFSAMRSGGPPPITFQGIVNSTFATLRAEESRRRGMALPIDYGLPSRA
jgi:predicted dehydrogenase/threonine dehydrogenase-like Zn-dependent dehydrogenase